eukprot:TRINITY_DN1204_c0_g2_i1.p1 TRINITY_DN1204_c0_g2~~TRINITY_DN1204_c0_g2_i1.p1  ORF type:complete len:198 (+),score=48.69 TRINITY_DN1204_c0_g2_i1:74-667(+)
MTQHGSGSGASTQAVGVRGSRPTPPVAPAASAPTKEDIVKVLGLQPHPEGGYFVETHRSAGAVPTQREGGERAAGTSILYLLTDESPITTWTVNKSDIVNYFHGGRSVKFYCLHPDGQLDAVVVGNNVLAGELPQYVMPAGCWRASEIDNPLPGEYALLGEGVAPGFDYRDMVMAKGEDLAAEFPQHREVIKRCALR